MKANLSFEIGMCCFCSTIKEVTKYEGAVLGFGYDQVYLCKACIDQLETELLEMWLREDVSPGPECEMQS